MDFTSIVTTPLEGLFSSQWLLESQRLCNGVAEVGCYPFFSPTSQSWRPVANDMVKQKESNPMHELS